MTKVVVIGGNGAGMSAASKARRRNPDLEVTVYEAGPHISYSACGIPHLVGGVVKDPDNLLVLSVEKAAERGVKTVTGTKVAAFNPFTKQVVLETKKGRDSVPYDKLLIATGAQPLNPFKGGGLRGVFALRHLEDGVRLMEHVDSATCKKVAVIGGGFTGVEMAEAFHKRGTEVHLMQRGDRLLPSFDPEITEGLPEWLGKKGIKVHLQAEVKSFGEGKRSGKVGVVHSKEKDVNIDAVLVAVGIQPMTQFAIKAGVHSLSSGHLLVDDQMRTNLHDVWAAGDCVAPRHLVTGKPMPMPFALPANRMGRVAGDNMAASVERIPGASQFFSGVVGTGITRIFGIAMAQTGLSEEQAKKEGIDVVAALVESKDRASYMPGASDMAVKVVAEQGSGKLVGVQFAGPADAALRINAAAVALQAGLTAKKLADVETAYGPTFSQVYDPMIVAASAVAKLVRK